MLDVGLLLGLAILALALRAPNVYLIPVFTDDPLDRHPHDPDIQAVQRVCNVHDVPLATNIATANLIISAEAV